MRGIMHDVNHPHHGKLTGKEGHHGAGDAQRAMLTSSSASASSFFGGSHRVVLSPDQLRGVTGDFAAIERFFFEPSELWPEFVAHPGRYFKSETAALRDFREFLDSSGAMYGSTVAAAMARDSGVLRRHVLLASKVCLALRPADAAGDGTLGASERREIGSAGYELT